jgi:hypothetical protein
MSQPATVAAAATPPPVPPPSKPVYVDWHTVLRVLVQIMGIACTIAFGVWAFYSYRLAQKESCRAHPVSNFISIGGTIQTVEWSLKDS